LAANVTHPESAAGSITVSAPIESATWDASAELHAGSTGAAVLLQPAAARSGHIRSGTALRRFMRGSALAFPGSCSRSDVHAQLHGARREEPEAANAERAPHHATSL